MASSGKRKAEDHIPPPKRRFKNPWENITEEERQRIMKDGDEMIARIDAIMAAEAAIPPEVRRLNQINAQQMAIMAHMRSNLYARVTIQKSPWSPRGSMCKFELCKDSHIGSGIYRIALKPGLASWHGSPDFFHVECFEMLVDLTSPLLISRIMPEYETNIDCAWILDGGAEHAVWRWIDEQKQHQGHSIAPNHDKHSDHHAANIPSQHPSSANAANDHLSVAAPFAEEGSIPAHTSGMQSVNSADSITTTRDNRGVEDNVTSVAAASSAKESSPAQASDLLKGFEVTDDIETSNDNRGQEDSGVPLVAAALPDRRHGLSQALNAWKAREATMTPDDPDYHLTGVTMRLSRFF